MTDEYETIGFMDASCRRCKARIGWYGRATDMPACNRCGHRPDVAELEHDQEEMSNFRQLLAELRQANPGWDKWKKARVAAGLTLRQAAKLLEVAPTTLSEIERCENKPSEFLAARMAACYSSD